MSVFRGCDPGLSFAWKSWTCTFVEPCAETRTLGFLQAVAAAAGDEVDEFHKETTVTQDDILNQELAIRGCDSCSLSLPFPRDAADLDALLLRHSIKPGAVGGPGIMNAAVDAVRARLKISPDELRRRQAEIAATKKGQVRCSVATLLMLTLLFWLGARPEANQDPRLWPRHYRRRRRRGFGFGLRIGPSARGARRASHCRGPAERHQPQPACQGVQGLCLHGFHAAG
jgi:hypothetical protein